MQYHMYKICMLLLIVVICSLSQIIYIKFLHHFEKILSCKNTCGHASVFYFLMHNRSMLFICINIFRQWNLLEWFRNLWVPQQWPPPMAPMLPTPLQQPVSVHILSMVAETWVAGYCQTEKSLHGLCSYMIVSTYIAG